MVSVVIPLYNKEKSIFKTINSVLNQTFTNFELIIVNDGSTDRSLEFVNNINDDRIVIISQRNSGVSAARNLGVENSKFNLIALLDGDDLWLPDFLEEMISLTVEFPEVSLYGCAYSFQFTENEILTPLLGFDFLSKGIIDYFSYAKDNTLFSSSSVVFNKHDFLSIGSFDINLSKGEDIDLWIRFGLYKKVLYYNKPLVIYKLDAENRISNVKLDNKASLICNLDRYKNNEKNNLVFKRFLDEWRLSHISNFLTGKNTEVREISSLLNAIDLSNKSILWKILKRSPGFLHKSIYKLWFIIKGVYYNFKC